MTQTAPFSAQACLPTKGWTIPPEEVERRLDLRNGRALVCSVDPPGCVDIDDALHAREIAPGKWEVGVHIADVGHFIKAGTAIDIEAAARATTVYLVTTRIDMVPKRLGEDLCSSTNTSTVWPSRLLDGCRREHHVHRFAKTVIKSESSLRRSADADGRCAPRRPVTNWLRTNVGEEAEGEAIRRRRAHRVARGALRPR